MNTMKKAPTFENFELDINCEELLWLPRQPAGRADDEVQSDAEAEEPAVDETGLDA